jgi:glutaredoxin-like protein
MSLLSDADRAAVQRHLDHLTNNVTLLFFTQTIGAPETVHMARQVVNELAELSPRVTVEEVNLVLDRDRAAQFNVENVPAIVLLKNGSDTRMRFLGVPAGYEFMSLVEAVTLAGTEGSGLQDASRTLLGKLTAPLDIKVFVTPTCVYCPRAVTTAHRMAVESPLVTATCVEATEFPELSRRYSVTGVPKSVANGNEIVGAVPEEDFVAGLLKGLVAQDSPPLAPPSSL